ncbi:class I SAM-dependent methyltransferase [Marinimicrobium alkaliphilum]|uniref:class I SAM-dependent methyltransferase n=1 Tax=Marinimicrobium alkaliphilum TaxID=2202654 RepID=UPI000DBA257A|nr:class I SAM-dependent methyltransferase [Marinimicrobium alkaliphilum]
MAAPRSLTYWQRKWQRRFGVLSPARTVAELDAWLQTPLGQALLKAEQALLAPALRDLFGYHLLQLSISPSLDLSESSRIGHRFALGPRGLNGQSRLAGQADFHALPLPSESVDLVILHHVLDYSPTPHQLLREAERVLIPHGYLVIIGCNPYSSLGLGGRIAQLFSRSAQWRRQSLGPRRMQDWLTLLDLDLVSLERGFYRPPVNNEKFLNHLQWLDRWGKRLHLPGGGFYQVVARKDVCAMTPLRPAWRDTRVANGLGAAGPLRSPKASAANDRYKRKGFEES